MATLMFVRDLFGKMRGTDLVGKLFADMVLAVMEGLASVPVEREAVGLFLGENQEADKVHYLKWICSQDDRQQRKPDFHLHGQKNLTLPGWCLDEVVDS